MRRLEPVRVRGLFEVRERAGLHIAVRRSSHAGAIVAQPTDVLEKRGRKLAVACVDGLARFHESYHSIGSCSTSTLPVNSEARSMPRTAQNACSYSMIRIIASAWMN